MMISFFKQNKWLLMRRISQFTIIAVFLSGPFFGYWIAKGSLAYSLTFDTLPLFDPLVFLQYIVSGMDINREAIIGVIIVVIFYFIVGGRVYCSWVCPVNIITDTARWLHNKLGIKTSSNISKSTRYYLLFVVLILPIVTGIIVWELVNPISVLFRGIVYGIGFGWLVLLTIFLLDLFVAKDLWCGRLCPVGAFYSLLGKKSLLKMRADNRDKCNDCLDCYLVCPESKILNPVLKGKEKPFVSSELCTNCGRCIDVCEENVFHFGLRG